MDGLALSRADPIVCGMVAKLVGHLDADCFYVSGERVRHAFLRRLPVGVLGNQGARVIAKSYELKACGVTTGMPIWEAVPRCPRTGCCWQESLDAGRWSWLRPEAVEIPACCGFEKGIWYQVQEGIHGVAVRDEHGQPHACVITQPATHYYAIMTRSERMPVLLNQTI